MTLEQEILVTESLAVLLAQYPKFIVNEATRLRNKMPDVEFYAGRKNKK